MVESLLANLLKTPQQVREEQMAQLQADALKRANAMAMPSGARTALPGIYAGAARTETAASGADAARMFRGITEGAGRILGAAGAPEEIAQGVSGLGVSPQERQAQALLEQREQTKTAALKYIKEANPELATLVDSGVMEAGEAIKSIQEAQKPVTVGDVLINPAKIDPQTKQAAIIFDARKRQPNTEYTILTAAEKKSLGLPIGVNYQKSPAGQITRIAGADVPSVGSIPVGYELKITTGDTPGQTTMRMDPIPGSPAAQEAQAQQLASQNKIRNTGKKVNSVTAIIDEARTLINDPDAWTTGLAGKGVDVAGQLTGGLALAGTPRLALRETLGTIRANIGFDRLQQMRDESPTGGALGQVAIQELNDLQRTLGSLNPDLDEKTLLTNLDKVETQYSKTAEALANAYTDEQLVAAGVPEIIAYRTGEADPETGEFIPFATSEPSTEDFDISVLPADIQAGWSTLDEETKKILMEAYQ